MEGWPHLGILPCPLPDNAPAGHEGTREEGVSQIPHTHVQGGACARITGLGGPLIIAVPPSAWFCLGGWEIGSSRGAAESFFVLLSL